MARAEMKFMDMRCVDPCINVWLYLHYLKSISLFDPLLRRLVLVLLVLNQAFLKIEPTINISYELDLCCEPKSLPDPTPKLYYSCLQNIRVCPDCLRKVWCVFKIIYIIGKMSVCLRRPSAIELPFSWTNKKK